MARNAPTFVCQACGAVYGRWQGKCDACGAWNSIAAESAAPPRPGRLAPRARQGPRLPDGGVEG